MKNVTFFILPTLETKPTCDLGCGGIIKKNSDRVQNYCIRIYVIYYNT